MNVSKDTAAAHRVQAQAHGHEPVICARFKHIAEISAGRIAYGNELAPTLSPEQTYAVYDARCSADERSIIAFSRISGMKFVMIHRSCFRQSDCERVLWYWRINTSFVLHDAVAVGNGQTNQITMARQANALDTMHDPQAVLVAHSLQAQGNDPNREDAVTYPITRGCVRRLTPL